MVAAVMEAAVVGSAAELASCVRDVQVSLAASSPIIWREGQKRRRKWELRRGCSRSLHQEFRIFSRAKSPHLGGHFFISRLYCFFQRSTVPPLSGRFSQARAGEGGLTLNN